MNRTEKRQMVGVLAARLERSPNLYLTDFTGIAVKPMTELRRKLRNAGVEYVVVKNTLALRALEEASVPELTDVVRGPTGFVFAGANPVAAAKVLADFQKEYQKLTIKIGLIDGRRMTADEVQRLATMPSREELLSQLGAAFNAPLQGFVGALTGLLYQFVGALDALRVKKGARC